MRVLEEFLDCFSFFTIRELGRMGVSVRKIKGLKAGWKTVMHF